MSDEKQETIADIIAEMRIFKCRNLETGELELCNAIANYLADRIEAAHKREMDALESQIDELRLGVEQYRQYNTKVVKECNMKLGNIAKMREALEAARDLILPQCNGGTKFARACGEVVNKIMSALAAPARNCDLYADGCEARDAWLDHEAKGTGDPWKGRPQDRFFDWLFATAQKGANDGSK